MNSLLNEPIGSVRNNLNRVSGGPNQFAFWLVLGWSVIMLGGAQAAGLNTDKAVYCPGETVTVIGTNWPAGESIELRLQPVNQMLATTVQPNGTFTNRGFVIFETNAGVRFSITATASPSGQTASTAPFDVPAKPFMIGPVHQTACPGGQATFTVIMYGPGPFTYQWSKAGQLIPGANSATLTITNVQESDTGTYTAVASTSCYSVTNSALLGTYLGDTGASLPGVLGGSMAWGDFDSDGWLDIAISGRDSAGTPITRVLRNQRDGTFANISTTFPGVAASSMAWNDYNNDGRLDLLYTGFDQTFANTLGRLYRNNGDGTFTDSGVALDGVGFGSATWADYNNDGRPDILMTGKNSAGAFVTRLYRNLGGTNFTEVAAGFLGVGYSAAAWGDYNNDNFLDMMLIGLDQTGNAISKLYRNNGNGTFTEVPSGILGISAGALAWGDYNNDGYLDLVLIGFDSGGPSARVYRNNGNGTFTDIAAGLDGASYCNVALADFNNDGLLDILSTGINTSTGVAFTKIYQNNGNSTFRDLRVGLPAGGIWHYAGSAALADFDNNGQLDLLLSSKDINDNPQTHLYRYCGTALVNQLPTAPSNLNASINGTSVTLTWNPSVDAETPQIALTYNLVLGTSPNAFDLFSPLADLSTGWRRVVRLGRINRNTTFTLTNLPTGNYYWSVQAIDSAMAGSPFATPSMFTAGSLTASTPLTNQSACLGETALFSTIPSGTGPFTFVWRKDGSIITGANTNTLTLSNLTLLDSGAYCVEVYGPLNSVTNCAQLNVGTIPSGTLTDQVRCPGESVTFNPNAGGGGGQFIYQWSKDGLAINGATNPVYTIASVSNSDAGAYCVVVANACASMTNCANLTVREPVAASPLAGEVRCPGESVTFSAAITGSGPFQYAWRKDGVLLNGQTNAALTFAAVIPGDAGVYSLEISGPCNRLTNSAALTVRQPAAITAPANLAACPGESALFAPVISGVGPFAFQWSKDGQIIADATNSSYAIAGAAEADAGNYCLVVQSPCNSVTNCTQLVVNTPVTATGPSGGTNCAGGQVTLSAVASGPGPITYRWSKDGQALAPTNASLTLNNLTLADAGNYCVVVQGLCNSVTNCASVVVNAAVTASGPQNQTNCAGSAVTLMTTPSGSGPLSIQWFKNGSPILNATNNTYSLPAVTEGDAGLYCVLVTDACSSVSNCATLTVRSLTAANGPTDQIACAGGSATLSTLASGTGPFVYQWFKDGTLLNDATNSSYTITNAGPSHLGTYTVIVQGACNSVTNSAALAIGTQISVSGLADQVGCLGRSITFSATATGAGPFTYQWFKGSTLLAGATNNTCALAAVAPADAGAYCLRVSGPCQTVTNCANLTVIQPITSTSLTNLVRCPGESASFRTTIGGGSSYNILWRKDGAVLPGQTNTVLNILIVTTNNHGLYNVEVTGSCNSVTNSATLTVNQPMVLSDLPDQTKCPGDSATFTITASGSGPFTYQWSRDGQPIAGATNSSLTLPAVQATNADNYCVTVQGPCNSATRCAHLFVEQNLTALGPVSQTNVMGAPVTLSVAVSGAGPFSYQWLKNGSPITGANSASYSIAALASGDGGTYCVIIQGACRRTTNCAFLSVQDLMTASPLISLTNCVGDSAIFATVVSMPDLATYTWLKDGQLIAGATNRYYIVSPVAVTNSGAYTVIVAGPYNSVTNSATLTVLIPVTATSVPNQMACEGSSVTFATTASGSGPLTYQWFKDGVVLPGATNYSYVLPSITLADAGRYAVVVSGACNSVTNSATLGIGLGVDLTNFVDTTNCLGSTVTFSVQALGNGPFTYEWSKDGVTLTNVTNSSLTIPAITPDDIGWYCAVVTGSCRSTNNCAYLAVQADTMATPLTSVTNCTGSTVMFRTVAYGAGPVTFEWYKDGLLLAGATNNEYYITNTVETNAGNYSAVVRGPCNSVTNTATLRFNYFVESGIVLPGLTGGSVAWGDYNNDSLLDIGISGLDQNGTPYTKVLRNRGDGSFSEIGTTFAATSSGTMAWGDYNNDGNLDLLVAGYDNTFSIYITRLYRNNGDGTFSNSGVGLEGMVYCSAAWGDYNNDGYLDILLAGKPNSGLFVTKLYRNNGNNTFSDIPTTIIGVDLSAVAWFDFNNDGRLDAVVTGMEPFGAWVSKLYRNDGNGLFTEVPADLLGFRLGAVACGDYNNDGYQDILLTGMSGIGILTKLYRNNGNGTFTDSGVSNILGACYSTLQWADFNNDGYLDVLETGFDTFATSITKVYRNNGDGSFTDLDVKFPGGQGFLANGMAAWADFNKDGRLDFLACGVDDFGVKVSRLYNYCGSAPSNTPPTAPTALRAVGTPNAARLSWNRSADAHTPTNALTYNLMIGTTPSSVNGFSPLADPNTGWRKVVAFGGQQGNTNWVLTNLTAGRYYWKVQAIDGGLLGSAWSAQSTFNVGSNTTLLPLVDQIICVGDNAQFSTIASGAAPFRYVWRKNGTTISGATNATLNIPNVTLTSAGTYCVEVTGAYGSATNCAALTVRTITSLPLADQDKCLGESVTFSNSIIGVGPFTYQWAHNGSNIAGATNVTFIIPSMNTNHVGQYTVLTFGPCSTMTNIASLFLNSPTEATPLASQVKCAGENASFSTIASGTGPFVYVWKKDGQLLSESTNNILNLVSLQPSNAGLYSVEISGRCNTVTNTADLTVYELTAATPLTPVTNCAGNSAMFATVVSGMGPFTFQWSKDGQPIAGATNTFYNISSSTPADAGVYCIVVQGLCNSVTNCATLIVNTPLTASALVPLTNCVGNSAGFATTVTGTGPFSYEWRKDGEVIAGATNSFYNIASLQASNAGIYSVVVRGGCNSATNYAWLTVYLPTTASPLLDQAKCPGENATFSTTVTGTGPFTYLWRKDGIAIAGQTNNALDLPAVTAADAALYSVEVTGTCTTVTNSARLTVNQLTAATPLTNLAKCGGETAIFSTVPSGTGPFRYTWQKDGSILAGQTNSTLTLTQVTTNDSGLYTVEVSGLCNFVTSSARLTVNRPTVATPLDDLGVCVGEDAVFSTSVSGGGPYVYEWRKNGVTIMGQNSNTLTLRAVTTNNAATYTVKVIGACNTVFNSALLTVNEVQSLTPLSGLVKCEGESATFSPVVTGLGVRRYVWRKDGFLLTEQTNSFLGFAAVTTNDAGLYTVEVITPCNTMSSSADLTVNQRTVATPLTEQIRCAGENVSLSTAVSGTGPFSYRWRKDGVLVIGETNNALNLAGVTTNASGIYTIEVSGLCNSVTNSARLTVNGLVAIAPMPDQALCPGENASFNPLVTGAGPFRFVWKKNGTILPGRTNAALTLLSVSNSDAGIYTVEASGACNSATNSAALVINQPTGASPLGDQVACAGDMVIFSTSISGTGPFRFIWRKEGVILNGQTNNTLVLPLVSAGDTGNYSVEVTGSCFTRTNTAHLTVNDLTTATPIQNQVKCAGENGRFSTTVGGTGPFRYVWRRDGVVLNGQTNSVLNLWMVSSNDAGLYMVTVSGACNSLTSSARLTVNQPTIASHLDDQAKCVGESASFSINVSGSGPFIYEWRKNGVVLLGQISNVLSFASVQTNDAAIYSVLVGGACNSVINSARLTVNVPVTVTPLSDVSKCVGEGVSFSAGAAGTGPLRYLWRKDGAILYGKTNNILNLASVNIVDPGLYSVEISGPCRTVTNSARLTVNEPLVISPMASQLVCAGDNVAFATVVSGSGPLRYVWRKDGAELSGQTNATLNLGPAATNQAGLYTVEVSGPCNSVTTSAQLSVNELTAIISLTDTVRCVGESASFSFTTSGTGPFRYLWRKDGVVLTNQTNSSVSWTMVTTNEAGLYTVEVSGACNTAASSARLTVNRPLVSTGLADEVRCVGESVSFQPVVSGTGPFSFVWRKDGVIISGQTSNLLELPSLAAAHAGLYSVEISGVCNTVTNTANLTVNELTLTTPLLNQVRCAGNNAQFSATPSGSGPFRFTWRKDGAILSGQTNSALNLYSLSLSDAGIYTVEVNGACNSVSSGARLTVNQTTTATILDDQYVCSGETALFSTSASGAGPFRYAWHKDGVVLAGQTNNVLTITTVRTNDAGLYTVTVVGSCNSVINSATLVVNEGVEATPLTDQTRCPGQSVTFSAATSGAGPFRYLWKKDGALLAGRTNNSLTLNPVNAGDAGLYTIEIYGACNMVSSSARLTVNQPLGLTGLGDQVQCLGRPAVFNPVVTGTGPYRFVWKKDGFTLPGQTNAQLSFTAVAFSDAGLYSVEVSGACSAATNQALLMVTQPTSATPLANLLANQGETVVFTTIASGTAPFTYVWRKDGILIPGAQSNTYTILSVAVSNAGLYSVEVSGTCGTVTNSAFLSVRSGTFITPLVDQAVCSGDWVEFSTVATGDGPFRYLWSKDGMLLAGQTNTYLNILSASETNAGVYCVTVIGSINAVTNCATLTVQSMLQITPLQDQTNYLGGRAVFRTVAMANGSASPQMTGPLEYAWYKDGRMLAGQTNSSLVIPNLKQSDAGTYAVLVAGQCNFDSSSARLTLSPCAIVANQVLSNGHVRVVVAGLQNRNIALDYTTNLVNWTRLGTQFNPTNMVEFIDPTAAAAAHRFYRAVVLP